MSFTRVLFNIFRVQTILKCFLYPFIHLLMFIVSHLITDGWDAKRIFGMFGIHVSLQRQRNMAQSSKPIRISHYEYFFRCDKNIYNNFILHALVNSRQPRGQETITFTRQIYAFTLIFNLQGFSPIVMVGINDCSASFTSSRPPSTCLPHIWGTLTAVRRWRVYLTHEMHSQQCAVPVCAS